MNYQEAVNHQPDSRMNCDAYQDAMLELMKEDQRVVHIDCDLLGCINGQRIRKVWPDRVINAGIAEANAMGVACGLSATGIIPYLHTFGVFAGRRMFDQAFLSSGYSRLPVHVVGTDPGITAAYNGGTHMPFEDCGLYLNIPDSVVLDPADYVQTYALTKAVKEENRLTYMRLIRRGFRPVYEEGSDFEIGKGILLREGKDVTIVASGVMVINALDAHDRLKAEGIDAGVIDMFTWKPYDRELLLAQTAISGCAVSVENHNAATGLGAITAAVLGENLPVPLEILGVHEQYGQVGSQQFLEKEYGLTVEDIVKACRKVIGRKIQNK